jgi:hypothetical protein
MSHGVHIVSVDLPDVPFRIAEALESEGLGAMAAAAGLGAVTVVVTFGDGKVYEYPNVPIIFAAAVKADPEGSFPTIKFWPGYRRVQ